MGLFDWFMRLAIHLFEKYKFVTSDIGQFLDQFGFLLEAFNRKYHILKSQSSFRFFGSDKFNTVINTLEAIIENILLLIKKC